MIWTEDDGTICRYEYVTTGVYYEYDKETDEWVER